MLYLTGRTKRLISTTKIIDYDENTDFIAF